jgi:hypothetical protein
MDRKTVSWLGCLLILSGCAGGLPDEVSDTGYTGTWQRGSDRAKSTFSIVEIDGEYLLRWDKRSDDGKVQVDCDWQGRCEESVEGEKTSEYRLRAWIDEGSGLLRMAFQGEVYRPTPAEFDHVDELRLRDDGLTLRFRRIEDRIRAFDPQRPPVRDYRKISDHVADPPEGWSPPSG